MFREIAERERRDERECRERRERRQERERREERDRRERREERGRGEERECRGERERRKPFFSQEKFYSARFEREGFRQCSFYRAIYDPGKRGRVFRQEKKRCMSFGRNFEDEERN